MQDAIQLYRALSDNRAFLRSVCEGVVFLAASAIAIFAAVVLLGHYHYSIDVLAALFITHGVFQISCWLFGRDYALFRSSEKEAVPRVKRAKPKALLTAGGMRHVAKPGGQPTGGS